jgi:subtilase family serine protease
MSRNLRRWGAAALLALAGTLAALSATGAAAATSNDIVYQVRPIVQQAGTSAFTNPFCHSATFICYSPNDIRKAYDYPAGLDGSGQTILIVDAYGSPTVQSDLATFDARFGIPAPPSFVIDCDASCPNASLNGKDGATVAGWAEETSLDVQWTHAMAPGANIVLVVAPNPHGNSINSAEQLAIQKYPGAIISQSFGSFESSVVGGGNNIQLQQAHANYVTAKSLGDTVLASAGDWGATNTGTTENATYPASDPLVTGIGGTMGDPYYNGTRPPCSTFTAPCSGSVGLATVNCTSSTTCTTTGYGGEQVWNEPSFTAATGGAESLLFPTPSYQQGVNGSTHRTTPDVSYNAAISGGVLTYLGFLGSASGFYIFGGTSAGSPQWASIVAIADQARGLAAKPQLGYLNDTVYALAQSGAYGSDFHDITVGNDQLAGTPFGYSAGAGYDIASGWGTPDVANLVASLS